MGILFALLIPLVALKIMTPAMRALSILVFLCSAAYAGWVKFGPTLFEPSTQQIGTLMTLLSLNIGLLILGTVMGLMKSACKTESEYFARRKALFKFVAVWGLPFIAFKQAIVFYIDSQSESGTGAFLLGFVGSYVLIAYVILAIIVRIVYGRLTGR